MLRRIVFGWHLDGPRFPDEPGVGTLTGGPDALTQQIALRLGLLRQFPPHAVRIAEYLARLRAFDDGARFYTKSFQTDPWGTSRALLQLRDELSSSGWNSGIARGGSERLDVLSDLECMRARGLETITDTLTEAISTIEAGCKPFVGKLDTVENPELLPPLWQRILRALAASGVQVGKVDSPLVSAVSDLGKITKALTLREQTELEGDGTLLVMESDDEVQAADFLSTLMQGDSLTERSVIIRGSSTSFLNQMLTKLSLPSLGNSVSSPLRGYAQLLPLALEMCWSPLDPVRLLELLTVPHSPVPAFAADCFVRALQREPGIGGAAWSDAWETALSRKRVAIERRSGDETENDMDAVVDATKTAWKAWLEPATFSVSHGLPASHAMAACRRVREHSLKLFEIHGDDVFAQTAEWADVLGAAIKSSEIDKISRAQLNRMLESVLGTGYSADHPQASAWTPVDHPGQILAKADTVIWWGFVHNLHLAASNSWSESEMKFLGGRDIHLELPGHRIRREASSWRRALTHAERLILVKPRTVEGQSVAVHPFYHEFAEQIEKSPKQVRARILRQAQEIYLVPDLKFQGLTASRQLSDRKPLPKSRSAWRVSPGAISQRTESPSSLERLLGCPLSWLLTYVARMRKGSMLSMPGADLLSGNLAHAVIGSTLSNIDALNGSDLEETVGATFDHLCSAIASPLMLPGNSLERSRLRKSVVEGTVHLAGILRDANFDSVETEIQLQGEVDGLLFGGRADMVLAGADGAKSVVLDLKLAKRTSLKRKELTEGRAIQLALYAWMNNLRLSGETVAGYYMIAQKQLLCSEEKPFPAYMHVQGPALEDTYANVLSSYKAHLEYLAQGTVYATGVDAPIPVTEGASQFRMPSAGNDEIPTPGFAIPGSSFTLEPPCKFCDYKPLCGKGRR